MRAPDGSESTKNPNRGFDGKLHKPTKSLEELVREHAENTFLADRIADQKTAQERRS